MKPRPHTVLGFVGGYTRHITNKFLTPLFCDVVFRRSKSILTLTIVDDTQEERSIGQEQSVVVVIDRSIAYNSVQHKSAQCYDQFTAK